ncbi:DUF4381 domain-containing protein [Alteromonas ponticola]|uniref:DUF4381 domain-containing protein n=1 Tax=Alteromonas ponticola TaxID=2720613 RepID=A0ABX1QZ30_9ALTE|nr:DUF4381 domain-containing protein [Alteromonas ponticola]NMH59474.1 DUF4381 domain-containing protein [Alteromonas ponticola]
MQAQSSSNPLAQLRDIHIPDDVSAWPLAWGWWVVIVVAMVSAAAMVVWLYKRHRFFQARRQAITEINALQPSQPDWAQQQNAILKRTASHYFDSKQIAPLYGQRWQQFLISCLAPKSKYKPTETGLDKLQQALYKPQPLNSKQFDLCQKACLSWLKNARFSKTASLEHTEAVNA